MYKNWLFMQLSDSAFPTGGFAHSAGLEAAHQLGEVQGAAGLEKFLGEALWQTGHGLLPLVNAAFENPDRIVEIDLICDAFLSGHVTNRASRVQGRTFLATCVRSFGIASIKTPNQHYAPIFGAVMNALELDRTSMQRLFLHGTFRSLLSAAIRLGIVGPYQGQQIQSQFSVTLDTILTECGELKMDELAQTAPLLELFQSKHDQLYSRLFQS